MLHIIPDRYNGLIVQPESLPNSIDEFIRELDECLQSVQYASLVWISIASKVAEFIPILVQRGFEFHSCHEQALLLVKKISPNAYVPTTKNFIVGVGAVVLHIDSVLVVKHIESNNYALPGGHIELRESIQEALIREVYEETGVTVEFESILNIGHFRQGQFGESNVYIVCTARAKDTTISVGDSNEIAEALWMNIDDFLQSEYANVYNKAVVRAAITNVELKLQLQSLPLRVSDAEVFL